MKYRSKPITIEVYKLGDMGIPTWLNQAILYSNKITNVVYGDKSIESMTFDNKELLCTHCIIQYDNGRLDYLDYEYLKEMYEPFEEPTISTKPNFR